MVRTILLFLCLLLFCSNSVVKVNSGKILHYDETGGFNHNTRNQSRAMFTQIAANLGATIDFDNDGSTFNSVAFLSQYDVIIFSNTSGNNILNNQQRANFTGYLQTGGSYIGIHAASDTYRHSTANGNSTGTYDFYAENAAGCSVQQGPNHTAQNHNNDMTHQVPNSPYLAGIPDPWNKTEEYYYWQNGYLNTTFTELLRVNQTGGNSYDAPRMMAHFKDLPWGGVSFYTALGHAQSNFTSDANFRRLLENAVECALNPNPFPVVWNSMDVKILNNLITLDFNVNQLNVQQYVVQVAENSTGDWQDTKNIVAIPQDTTLDYSVTFPMTQSGGYGIRVKSIDFDGTIGYSPTRYIEIDVEDPFVVVDGTYIFNKAGKLINLEGKVLANIHKGAEVNINLPAGVYIYSTQFGSKKITIE